MGEDGLDKGTSEQPDGADFDAHRKWKKLSAPMYDWMTNHHMTWPGLACRFGPRTSSDGTKYEQTIYFSDQVGQDEKGANKLVKANVVIPEEGYSPMDHLNSWKENQRSPYFKKDKTVIHHPGDCNKIMDIKQVDDVVVTHGDCEEVFVWHFERQALANSNNKHRKGKSVPDVRLTGHTKHAPFALSTSATSPTIASGGEDRNVVVWNLNDYAASPALGLPPSNSSALTRAQCTPGDVLQQRLTLEGHENTVTSVCFKPGSDNVLLSTADDRVIKIWDVREKNASCTVSQTEELMCSDWSACENMIATGTGNGITHVYDVRKFTTNSATGEVGEPVLEFVQYVRPQKAVLAVAWNPRNTAWLGTSGDDGRVVVYDTARPSEPTADRMPSQLVLQHIGHLGNIMECQWSPHDEFMMMSVSNDSDTYKDGGALQLWRLSFLLHKPVKEAMELLKSHQKWLETGNIEDIPPNVPPGTVPAALAQPAAAAQPAVPPAPGAAEAPAVAAAAPGAAEAPAVAAAAAVESGAPPVDTSAPEAAAADPAENVGADGDVAMAGPEVGMGGGADESAATGVVVGDKDAAGDVEMQDS